MKTTVIITLITVVSLVSRCNYESQRARYSPKVAGLKSICKDFYHQLLLENNFKSEVFSPLQLKNETINQLSQEAKKVDKSVELLVETKPIQLEAPTPKIIIISKVPINTRPNNYLIKGKLIHIYAMNDGSIGTYTEEEFKLFDKKTFKELTKIKQ